MKYSTQPDFALPPTTSTAAMGALCAFSATLTGQAPPNDIDHSVADLSGGDVTVGARSIAGYEDVPTHYGETRNDSRAVITNGYEDADFVEDNTAVRGHDYEVVGDFVVGEPTLDVDEENIYDEVARPDEGEADDIAPAPNAAQAYAINLQKALLNSSNYSAMCQVQKYVQSHNADAWKLLQDLDKDIVVATRTAETLAKSLDEGFEVTLEADGIDRLSRLVVESCGGALALLRNRPAPGRSVQDLASGIALAAWIQKAVDYADVKPSRNIQAVLAFGSQLSRPFLPEGHFRQQTGSVNFQRNGRIVYKKRGSFVTALTRWFGRSTYKVGAPLRATTSCPDLSERVAEALPRGRSVSVSVVDDLSTVDNEMYEGGRSTADAQPVYGTAYSTVLPKWQRPPTYSQVVPKSQRPKT